MAEEKHTRSLNPLLMQYQAVSGFETQKSNKIKEFMERLAKFENIETLSEAKELATKIMPTANEVNRFYIENAKCVVINKDNMLRISLDTPEEFISYDFR